MVHIKSITGFNKVIKLEKTVIVFGSLNCNACKKVTEIVVPLLKKVYEDVNFIFVDSDKFSDLADQYTIKYYPTLLYFKKGEMEKRLVSTSIKEIENAFFK